MNENIWLWIVGGILGLFSFFASRWINRIDEDRKAQAQQQQKDKDNHESRLLHLERQAMLKTEVSGWLGRLDRDRQKLEDRLNHVETNAITKHDAITMYQELKADVRYQIRELRENRYL